MKQSTVTVDGVAYLIRELTIAEMMPIMPSLQSDPYGAQLRMLALSTDNPEIDKQIGMTTFKPLINEVMTINGFGDDDDEGKQQSTSEDST
jgi:hypothetical protein